MRCWMRDGGRESELDIMVLWELLMIVEYGVWYVASALV